jgi:hypothetical protein
LTSHRGDLQSARDLFAAVGTDEAQGADDRAQALTNLGNSLGGCGRHIEALSAYVDALAVRVPVRYGAWQPRTDLLYRAAEETHFQYALRTRPRG